MMDYQCQLQAATRNNALRLVEDLSNEQLNLIPQGYNNNLIWHLGHILVTHQLLCYRLSDQPSFLSNDFINRYRKGSKPEGIIEENEVDNIKRWLKEVPAQFEKDFNAGLFHTYKPYMTSYGAHLSSIQEAALFNNMHESMHLGNIISMKKLV